MAPRVDQPEERDDLATLPRYAWLALRQCLSLRSPAVATRVQCQDVDAQLRGRARSSRTRHSCARSSHLSSCTSMIIVSRSRARVYFWIRGAASPQGAADVLGRRTTRGQLDLDLLVVPSSLGDLSRSVFSKNHHRLPRQTVARFAPRHDRLKARTVGQCKRDRALASMNAVESAAPFSATVHAPLPTLRVPAVARQRDRAGLQGLGDENPQPSNFRVGCAQRARLFRTATRPGQNSEWSD